MRVIDRGGAWFSTSSESTEKSYINIKKELEQRLNLDVVFKTSITYFGDNIAIDDLFHEVRRFKDQLKADGFQVLTKRGRNYVEFAIFKSSLATRIKLFFSGYEEC